MAPSPAKCAIRVTRGPSPARWKRTALVLCESRGATCDDQIHQRSFRRQLAKQRLHPPCRRRPRHQSQHRPLLWSAERKQYQDRFADLVARAEAGDKEVDYTALRTAYAYSEHWDFYSPQVVSLLQQAAAAKKGGDCTTTMSATDDLLKLNFTVSEAHEFRHDCLEDTDRAKARIESDIADGLTDSLMNSGDGESEKTAYVVNTQEEENRVLVHKHYQLRGRQTEVRGSDGHFYDTVTAIEIENTTFNKLCARPDDLFQRQQLFQGPHQQARRRRRRRRQHSLTRRSRRLAVGLGSASSPTPRRRWDAARWWRRNRPWSRPSSAPPPRPG